jgi:2-oxoglutarate ferredoxin oxidoreductase subunit beta
VNTFAWYKQRCSPLPPDYDPTDWEAAIKTSMEFGDKIPVGVIYKDDRPPFESHFPVLKSGPLCDQKVDVHVLEEIMMRFV